MSEVYTAAARAALLLALRHAEQAADEHAARCRAAIDTVRRWGSKTLAGRLETAACPTCWRLLQEVRRADNAASSSMMRDVWSFVEQDRA